MEASRWNFREFPVLLRRYDLAGPRGALEDTSRDYEYCDEIPLMVKTEYDVALHAERRHQQEQEDSLAEIGLHIKEEDDFVIKTEDKIGAVGIKQELDIGPMVLQSKTVFPLLPPSTFVSSHASPPAPCVSANSVDRTTFSSSLGISHDEDTSIVTVNQIQNQIGEKLHRLEYYDCNASKIGHAKEHIHTHAGHRPYKCNRCEYSTFRMHTFKVHRCTHKTEELYKCDVCEYSTSRMTSLKEHTRTHIEDKPYKCADCDYSTSRMGSLKEHMRTHKVEKAYKVERLHKCEECGYSTRRRDSLKRHMSTHTGEKPYKCEYCEYCASQSGHITAHMRIHTGEKPYKCEECGYSTTYSGNLMTHRRTHTGEKPHSCEYCEYKTSRRGRLYTHYFESHFRSTQ